MALKGNLRDFPIANLLGLIRSARKTGTLIVERAGQAAHLAFQEGQLIHATYARQVDLLDILEGAGVLSREQATAVLPSSTETSDKELALMLISAGVATQEDILRTIRARTLDIACDVLTWPSGEFRFEDGERLSEGFITTLLDTQEVMAEAQRRQEEAKRSRVPLPDLQARFRIVPTPPQPQPTLPPEAWRLLPFVDPRNTVQQIAQAAHLDEAQAQRILRDLVQAGVIEPQP